MGNDRADGTPPAPQARFENAEEYIRGFLAAIRTHRKLNDDEPLEPEIYPRKDLPLAQRVLLR